MPKFIIGKTPFRTCYEEALLLDTVKHIEFMGFLHLGLTVEQARKECGITIEQAVGITQKYFRPDGKPREGMDNSGIEVAIKEMSISTKWFGYMKGE